MFTQIENFFTTVFSDRDEVRLMTPNEESILRLPLERTALEQINYTNWLYGGGVTKMLEVISQSQYSEEIDDCLQFNYSENTFFIHQTDNIKLDEFYFLFDYIKEVYLGHGYRVTDAIKELKSESSRYVETERYVLIDSNSHHLVKLEIVSEQGKILQIAGWGYPTDDDSSVVNQPRFFKIVNEVFQRKY